MLIISSIILWIFLWFKKKEPSSDPEYLSKEPINQVAGPPGLPTTSDITDINGDAFPDFSRTNTYLFKSPATAREYQFHDDKIPISISPNPFVSLTIINFNLPEATKISLNVYDINGQLVEELLSDVYYPKGPGAAIFSPKKLVYGFYFIVLITDTDRVTMKALYIGK